MQTAAMAGFGVEDLRLVLLVGSVVLLLAVVAVRVSTRSGLPSLLLYLLIGVALGESGLGIQFEDTRLTQALGYTALVIILSEGGLTTSWRHIRPSVAPAALLSTAGVLVSVAVIGVAAHLMLPLDWPAAMLVGAVLSSTDAAAVFSVLRSVPLPRRLTGMLEAESGFNDAPVVILVTALTGVVAGTSHAGPLVLFAEAVVELVVGTLAGLAVGWLGTRLLHRYADTSSGLFSIGVLAVPGLAYAVATYAHGSGFIAVYVAALVLGNSSLPHKAATRGFATAMGWLAQIGLFVLLGLLASPSQLARWAVPAVVLGLVLLLVARPLSVLVSATPFGIGAREQVFLSWAGLRGAVPVVLATVPATEGAQQLAWLFDLVFMLVVIYTVVQGPTLPWVARRLGVIDEGATMDLQVESTPLERMNADVVQVEIGDESRLAGVEVYELRLPRGASVALVLRRGRSFVPERSTVLRRGDALMVVMPSTLREATEERLRAVSEQGRLAGWLRPGERPPPARIPRERGQDRHRGSVD
ncbi:potassium/proton antiporter [Arsenicicoccus dermatophilus]|uniref:potassium/proton antiporter n=1 Tax=Arsenicicoccus dermatophilus TaxID=1076331 RepID=UPI001F4C954C|nr:potassium/proton antiporter [Arsenicicoccus dermatophilus]MCH8612085.1 potassium/proton antiporter [Arsenicicoccus dermatophilus]